MTVFLQSLGQFFWVFILNEMDQLNLYKVMGETVEAGWGQQVSGSVSMWMHIAEGSGFLFDTCLSLGYFFPGHIEGAVHHL